MSANHIDIHLEPIPDEVLKKAVNDTAVMGLYYKVRADMCRGIPVDMRDSMMAIAIDQYIRKQPVWQRIRIALRNLFADL